MSDIRERAKVSGVVIKSNELNGHGKIYGTSKYQQPLGGGALVAEADLENFAPAATVCGGVCIHDKVRKRTYARVYENRIEYNWPSSPFCCLTKERCVGDNAGIWYFDKMPNRSGMSCGFIPFTCCGQPVIFNKVPKCCGCIDMTPCFGETIFAAPCSCWNLKCCCGCCGAPCYQSCACPIFPGIKNGESFLAAWKGALGAYYEKHGLSKAEQAKFVRVVDGFCNCDTATEIEAQTMDR